MAAAAVAKREAKRMLRVAAAAYDTVARVPAGVTILIYHRVGARTSMNVDLPASMFDEHLAELTERHSVITLDRAVELLASGDERSPSAVVVTFDDGTDDWVDAVLPALDRHKVPATFYVATDFVESGRDLPDDGRPVTWAGLAELVSSGWATIGGHTHTHTLLDRADRATTAAELDRSNGLIEERLGLACRHFAYPKALAGSPQADAEVRRRYDSAVVAGNRPNPYGRSDRYALRRSPITRDDTGTWFARKAAGGLRLEDDARRLLNRRRYAGATT